MTATPRHRLRGLHDPVRTRLQIIVDYARAHGMTVKQLLAWLGEPAVRK